MTLIDLPRSTATGLFRSGCLLVLFFLFIFFAHAARAANHYVLPSPGTGSHNGSDWSNACAGFTGSCDASSMTRGDTYYLGGGNYGAGFTFSTPTSGTTLITIKGATASDHGTATGWSSKYGVDVTPADIAGVWIQKGYLTLDGAVGSGTTGSSYGFTTGAPGTCSNYHAIFVGVGSDTVNNVQISHYYLPGCVADTETIAIAFQTTTDSSNDLFSYDYFHNWQVAVYAVDPTNLTVDHNYFDGAQSYSDNHGNQVDMLDGAANLTFSNNVMLSCAGTVCIGANDTGGTCSEGVSGSIYGNVFKTGSSVGNGIIGATTRCFFHDTKVYNNTFTGTTTKLPWFQGCVEGAATCSSSTVNVVENNLVWSASCELGGGVTTHDYNSYLSCIDTPPSESHGQTGNFNPFANADNYMLASPPVSSCSNTSATCAGIALSDVFSLDPIGISRELDGLWARGAYQYRSSSGPGVPTSLTGQLQGQ